MRFQDSVGTLICETCQSPFSVQFGTRNHRSVPRFCSKRCMGLGFRKRPESTCALCGAAFHRPPAQRRRGRGRFCSRTCKTISQMSGPDIRVWPLIVCDLETQCWMWTGAIDRKGYGRVWNPGRTALAHRIVWELLRSPLIRTQCLLHTCDTPLCVNPDHLWIGTRQDNNRDRDSKGRVARGARHSSRTQPDRVARGARHMSRTKPWTVARGEMSGSAKLTEQDVRSIRIRFAKGGISKAELGRQFAVTDSNVRAIVNGRTWQHVS
jgi:hypothetical protein